MGSETASLTDRQLLDKVARNIKGTETIAIQMGSERTTFSMDLVTAKRLLALAEAGMPKVGVAIPSMIDVTPREVQSA